MLCHSIGSGHNEDSESDFQIIGKGYRHHTQRRKICEVLFIKNKKAINIVKPLIILFLSFLEEGAYPDDWKKSNVVPVHKKESKKLIKNYRPISLLPVFSKVFERIIFNSLFNYFPGNKLFTEYQSGFLPGDSCILQFLSITHEIYKCFDCNPSLV